jgi:uncharacterized membrane protein
MAKMMFWDGGGWAWWQAGLMWVAMIAFWCLLIWGIYALITAAAQRAGQPERGADAHRILDERLARGRRAGDPADHQLNGTFPAMAVIRVLPRRHCFIRENRVQPSGQWRR